MTAGLTSVEFDARFQQFVDSPTSTSVFRWEALQQYSIERDDPAIAAFRAGTPRPERSVRTSPWLARIATSTVAGKSWVRVRLVVEPLSEYSRYEMVAYVESQAAGERILIARDPLPVATAECSPDFWLFDGTTGADRFAVLMHYDDEGRPLEFELMTDPLRVERLGELRRLFTDRAVPLNTYLAPNSG